jgi:2,5-dihydroxypyridine 5,6-dioxygenase
MTENQNWDITSLFGAVLDLCKVKPGETLAVFTEGLDREPYAAAYLAAAAERGVPAFHVNVAKKMQAPGSKIKTTSLSGNAAAVEALKTADLMVDLVGLLWSAEQRAILAAGTRILTCKEPVENIVRMFPTRQLRERVERGAERLGKSKKLQIRSPAGTDVEYDLGQYPVVTQYGYTDEPGRWDLLPGGFLYTGAFDEGVNGVVVIAPGDIVFPFRRYLTGAVTMTIENGRVVDIGGHELEAELIRTYMARFNDPRAYAVSHIGWGMDEKAQWDFLAASPLAPQSFGVDARSFYGNVLFSTGPNSELGGTNDTGCHFDIPLRNCDLYLDGECIVKAGDVVPADLRA